MRKMDNEPSGIVPPKQADPKTGDRCVYFRIRHQPFSIGRRDFSVWLSDDALYDHATNHWKQLRYGQNLAQLQRWRTAGRKRRQMERGSQ